MRSSRHNPRPAFRQPAARPSSVNSSTRSPDAAAAKADVGHSSVAVHFLGVRQILETRNFARILLPSLLRYIERVDLTRCGPGKTEADRDVKVSKLDHC